MKLKPCPFCGSKVKHLAKFDVVYCSNVECGLNYENGGGYTVEYWNTRPVEDKQAEQNKRLKEAVRSIHSALEWSYDDDSKRALRIAEQSLRERAGQ